MGGIERHIDYLRRGMPDVRSDVLVCSRSSRTAVASVAGGTERRVRELGPRILAVPMAPETLLEVRRSRAELIHVHVPYPLGELAALVGAGDRPIVCSFHADVVRQARWLTLYKPLVQLVLDRAAAIIVGSARTASESPVFGPPRSVDVIPYGVDLERFDPAQVSEADRAATRARYRDRPLIVAVGRLVYYKGFNHLIAAAHGLDAEVVLLGDGPERVSLSAMAETAENVHVLGAASDDDLRLYLSAADVFVLPSTSRAESFGLATAEAQAMGLPAVVTDVGTGTTEAIAPGETGVAIPPRDPAALHAVLAELIADPERLARLGGAARRRAALRFDWRARAADVRMVYRRLVDGG